MRNICTCMILLTSAVLLSQPSTEVYLMDLDLVEEDFKITSLGISNFRNVSNDAGYDNQPSFYNSEVLLFAGNNGGQTDIASYDIPSNTRIWVNTSTPGGEYSPQVMEYEDQIAAVRLDPDGLQRLYKYNSKTGASELLINELQVAYYAFYRSHNKALVASVLSNGELDLTVTNLETKAVDTIAYNVGRSIQVSDTQNVMYTAQNEEKNYEIFQLAMLDGLESFFVCQLPVGIQDFAFIGDSRFIIGSGSKLYVYDQFGSGDWKEVADLSAYKIKNITRLAVSPNGTKLALVAEPISEIKK